jgi:hypothetical protein
LRSAATVRSAIVGAAEFATVLAVELVANLGRTSPHLYEFEIRVRQMKTDEEDA